MVSFDPSVSGQLPARMLLHSVYFEAVTSAAWSNLSRFILPRPFLQPAAETRPRSCGGCRPTTRQRLVLRLCRGTGTLFVLSRFIPPRPFLQPAAMTRPPSCGGCRPTTRQRLVWRLCWGTWKGFIDLQVYTRNVDFQSRARHSSGDIMPALLYLLSAAV